MIFFRKKNQAKVDSVLKKTQTTATQSVNKKTVTDAIDDTKTRSSDLPVLLNIIELGKTQIAIDAIIKLILEREHHHALLAKLEQHEFPEIAARCQMEIQTYLQESLVGFSENASEHMGKMLRAELRLAMMHMISTEKNT